MFWSGDSLPEMLGRRKPESPADAWWNELKKSAPGGLAGLWFGITELVPGGWHLYVAGTATFDRTDESADWAVGPYAWWPRDRYLPLSPSSSDPAAVLESATAVVRAIAPWRDLPVTGVAVGFDDGDFTIVHG